MAVSKHIYHGGIHHLIGNNPLLRKFALFLLMLFLLLSLSGCATLSDLEASQDYTVDGVGILDSQTLLGQSFISRRSNLNGLTIWLTPLTSETNSTSGVFTNSITASLYHSPEDTQPVFSTTVSTPLSGNNFPLTINIPNQKNLAGQGYYLQLTMTTGSIQVNGRNEDIYPGGQAYLNGQAVDADIAFRLNYDYDLTAMIHDARQLVPYAWLVAPLLILLWLPGWLLLDVSGLRSRFDFGGQIALSLGLSLAVIPIFMLWTSVLKIKWSRDGIFYIFGFLLIVLIVRLIYSCIKSRQKPHQVDHFQPQELPVPPKKFLGFFSSPTLYLILIFLGSLVVRLIMVRDLATPAWVDSVHHALITRIILDTGAYPSSYLPYFELDPTAYHPGFHSIAAVFTWLSNLDLSQSILILGQVLNALSVFSVYLLTITLTRSTTAGIMASFITGFLTPMPAYYASWGRYTELTGLLLVPIVLAFIQAWLEGKLEHKRGWITFLGALSAGGLFLIHYRVVVFLGCLLLSFVLFQLIFRRAALQKQTRQLVILISIITVISVIYVLPWFVPTFKNTVAPKINTLATSSALFFQDFSWPYLTSALGKQALALAGLGLLWSIIKQRSPAFMISLWVLSLLFLSNLDALKLPGGGLITTTSVEIMLFIPISILGGYFIAQLVFHWKELVPRRFISASFVIFFTLLGCVAYLGAKQLVAIINPVTILSRAADLPAIQWVNEHIPKSETIVINPFAWGYGLFAGNDGGYWISPLTGRDTLPPPVLYGLGSGAKPINQQAQEIVSLSADAAALCDYMSSQKLHYVYVGVRGGVISPKALASSGLFDVLYHQDGVWIFILKP